MPQAGEIWKPTLPPMDTQEKSEIADLLKRARAYSDEAIEMLVPEQAHGFRHAIKEAKVSLDRALALFTTSEDRRQSS
jgi:CHAD domain-containing protein